MIRGSEVDTFLSCRRKYGYEYLDQIEAKKPQKALYFGSLFHKFVEVYNQTRDINVADLAGTVYMEEHDLSEMDQVDVQEMTELYETLPNAYVEYWKDQDAKRETIATELIFRIPMLVGVYYVGTIDHILRDTETGKVWIEDTKTVKSVPQYLRSIEYNRQFPRYLYAVNQLAKGIGEIKVGDDWLPVDEMFFAAKNKKPAGVIVNLVSKNQPHPPKTLVKGGLSVDKSQRTTLALYEKALREIGAMDEEKYIEILKFLEDQETPEGNKFFRRQQVLYNEHELQHAFNTVVDVAEEVESETKLFRSEGIQCAWCQYKPLCYAEKAGENVEMILDTMYQPKADNPYDQHEEEPEIEIDYGG